jgi:hypothetical protein
MYHFGKVGLALPTGFQRTLELASNGQIWSLSAWRLT